jgi:hypothetical protein
LLGDGPIHNARLLDKGPFVNIAGSLVIIL